jgi:hypothetical protein
MFPHLVLQGLLVSRIIYPLLNKANHVKVEAHMAPPLPLTSLSIPQYPIYKIENNESNIVRFMHRNYKNKN